MTEYDELDLPKGLSAAGTKAHEAIMGVLENHDALDGGGCKGFYTPAEWSARGETYGCDSLLIVVYDGSDMARFFNMDHERYDLVDEMAGALEGAGTLVDACTGWYSAVYSNGSQT